MKVAHWGMAAGIIGTVFFVKKAQWYHYNKRTPKENEQLKFYYMRLHKSFGLLMAFCLVPRLFFRTISRLPPPPEGHPLIQKSGVFAHQLFNCKSDSMAS